MVTFAFKPPRRVLSSYDRISEILCGLIMVLTFTGSLSVAEQGRQAVSTMLVGAIGCNLAWGIVDGMLYLMGCLAERGKELRDLRAVRRAGDPEEGRRIIAEALPPLLVSGLPTADLEAARRSVTEIPEPPERPSLHKDDWIGAVAICLLVFCSTFPVIVPFLFADDVMVALRVSNGISIGMLFFCGCAFGRSIGRRALSVGFSMVIVGALLVAATIALNG